MNWFKKKFPFVLAYLLVPTLVYEWLGMTGVNYASEYSVVYAMHCLVLIIAITFVYLTRFHR
ncbi:TPA: hypothetical protein TXJ16_000966 [Streptococcus suis]|uniref:hypothetical protein n=1 Tax=Streptococcus suivaginalis TaxID=3028082 RepID=UPI0020041B0C|nr:hypothetical protein [Streptococcus suis]HEL1586456.1 hypothetical protein [Streptococcus suis]